jgi:hypothetical protein
MYNSGQNMSTGGQGRKPKSLSVGKGFLRFKYQDFAERPIS